MATVAFEMKKRCIRNPKPSGLGKHQGHFLALAFFTICTRFYDVESTRAKNSPNFLNSILSQPLHLPIGPVKKKRYKTCTCGFSILNYTFSRYVSVFSHVSDNLSVLDDGLAMSITKKNTQKIQVDTYICMYEEFIFSTAKFWQQGPQILLFTEHLHNAQK